MLIPEPIGNITSILESITDGFYVLDEQWRFTFVNDRAVEMLRPLHDSATSLIGQGFWEKFPDVIGTEVDQKFRQAVAEKAVVDFELWYAPLHSWFAIRGYPSHGGLTVYFQDITKRKQAEAFLNAEKKVLGLIADGRPLADVLENLTRETEALSVDGMLCSVLLADEAGERLHHGAAPSLPDSYNQAIHGVRIGAAVGSCGTAAHERRKVTVSDVATDPLWANFKDLALAHGLAACTSSPIISSQGRLLGTIAMYYRSPRCPSERDTELIDLARHLASIAIDRQQREETLKARDVRLRATFEQAAVGIVVAELDGRFVEFNDKFAKLLGYSPRELKQLTFEAVTFPDDLSLSRSHIEKLITGQLPDLAYEKRIVRKNGPPVWCLCTVTLLRDSANQPDKLIGVVEDISQRKKSEEAVRRSEQELQALADSIPQLAWMAEPDGYIFWFNRGWYAYTGATPEQMQGWGWKSVHDPNMLPTVTERWQHSLDTGTPFEMEFPLRGADGQYRWFLTRVNPVRDQEGQVTRWFGTNTDVDEVRRTRDALREETRILELLNKTGQSIGSSLDLQELVQTVTDAATQLIDAKFGAFFYNVVDNRGESLLLYALSGAPRDAFEKFGLPRNTPIFDPTFRGQGILRSPDITQDSRYGKMSPHYGMPEGHLPVRSYLAVPVISRSGSVIGGLFFGHPEADVFSERAERIISGVAAQAAVAIDNSRLYEAVKIASDEREQLLEAERAARSEAERVSLMKDEFLATLSHELRTPLSAILGWAQVLATGKVTGQDLLDGLATIQRNARIQAQLIEDLLDMSRIISGKIRLDVQRINLADIVEAAVSAVRPSAESKSIRLRKVVDPMAGPVAGDPNRLQQVVWNLLTNAVKFTPKGGKIDVLLERVNSHFEITVSDSGIGIAPEFLPHIFERFRQADSSTTRRYGGLGIGLSIVKQLVELHGGNIRARSDGEGQGTTFIVSVPVAAVRHEQRLEHPTVSLTAPSLSEDINLDGIKVLVVDDEPDARSLIKRVLSDCQAQVITAASAVEGMELLVQERPDVLVSDIGMPEKDGLQFIREIRRLAANEGGQTPAIALTAFARSEDRTRAMLAGYQVHTAKPIEPLELIATVASLAGRMGNATTSTE